MATEFPRLDKPSLPATRDALHAYARVLGGWAGRCRRRRKHWWHASLRPSLDGLTTGVVYAAADFELELDLRRSLLCIRIGGSDPIVRALSGQPAEALAHYIAELLTAAGINPALASATGEDAMAREFAAYDPDHAAALGRALRSVAAVMSRFRAGIPEETSPIQVWPHHFDLAMLWLPGEKIAGEDPSDEEASDKQMNFGFVFGDAAIPEPYFYVTVYPLPAGLTDLPLPAGTHWHTQGFTAAVLPYRRLIEERDPEAYLLQLWDGLLSAGRERLSG